MNGLKLLVENSQVSREVFFILNSGHRTKANLRKTVGWLMFRKQEHTDRFQLKTEKGIIFLPLSHILAKCSRYTYWPCFWGAQTGRSVQPGSPTLHRLRASLQNTRNRVKPYEPFPSTRKSLTGKLSLSSYFGLGKGVIFWPSRC